MATLESIASKLVKGIASVKFFFEDKAKHKLTKYQTREWNLKWGLKST
jgi:hypothetical protein